MLRFVLVWVILVSFTFVLTRVEAQSSSSPALVNVGGSNLNVPANYLGFVGALGNLEKSLSVDLDGDLREDIVAIGSEQKCDQGLYGLHIYFQNDVDFTKQTYPNSIISDSLSTFLDPSGLPVRHIITGSSSTFLFFRNQGNRTFFLDSTFNLQLYSLPFVFGSVFVWERYLNDLNLTLLFGDIKSSPYGVAAVSFHANLTLYDASSFVPSEIRYNTLAITDFRIFASGNFDSDDIPDIFSVIPASNTTIFLKGYRNCSWGAAQIATVAYGYAFSIGAEFLDFNFDGMLDIVFTEGMFYLDPEVSFWQNMGDFTFAQTNSSSIPPIPVRQNMLIAAVPPSVSTPYGRLIVQALVSGSSPFVAVYQRIMGSYLNESLPSIPWENCYNMKLQLVHLYLSNRVGYLVVCDPSEDAPKKMSLYLDDGPTNGFIDVTNRISTSTLTTLSIVDHPFLFSKDFNMDGCSDIFVYGAPSGRDPFSLILQGNCLGNFTSLNLPLPVVDGSLSVLWLDGLDGASSRMITNQYSSYSWSQFTLFSNGTGSQVNFTSYLPSGMKNKNAASLLKAQFNNDGIDDFLAILISSYPNVVHMLIGNANGSFSEYGAPVLNQPLKCISCKSPSMVDEYGNNGMYQSYVMTTGYAVPANQTFSYVRNLKNGSFSEISSVDLFVTISDLTDKIFDGYSSLQFWTPDLNGDQASDFVITSNPASAKTIVKIFLQSPNHTFYSVANSGFENVSLPVIDVLLSAIDINEDGFLDLLISGFFSSTQSGYLFVYLGGVGSGGGGSVQYRNATEELFGTPFKVVNYGKILAGHYGWKNPSSNQSNSKDMSAKPFVSLIGEGGDCGITIYENIGKTAATLSTTSGGEQSAVVGNGNTDSSEDSSQVALIAGIVSAVGMAGLMLMTALLVGCVLCVCCAILSIVICVAVVAIFIAIAILSAAASGSGGAVLLAVLRKRRTAASDHPRERDEELTEDGESVELAQVLSQLRRPSVSYAVFSRNDFEICEMLGQGSEATVYSATWQGVPVAVKELREVTKSSLLHLGREAELMQRVSNHPHMAQLVGLAVDDSMAVLVTHLYPGGSLADALKNSSSLIKDMDKDRKASRLLAQVASALAYMHKEGLVHADVCARNILIGNAGEARLSDLGRALEVVQPAAGVLQGSAAAESAESNEDLGMNMIGPVRWMAPETIRQRRYSPASDAYSFGMLMYEVYSGGQIPYGDVSSVIEVAKRITCKDLRPSMPLYCPNELKPLLLALWSRDPEGRPTMEEAHDALMAYAGTESSQNTSNPSSPAVSPMIPRRRDVQETYLRAIDVLGQ